MKELVAEQDADSPMSFLTLNSTLTTSVIHPLTTALSPQVRAIAQWSGTLGASLPGGGYTTLTLLVLFLAGVFCGQLSTLLSPRSLAARVRRCGRRHRREKDPECFDSRLESLWWRLSYKALHQPEKDAIIKKREYEWGRWGAKIIKGHPWHKEHRERTKVRSFLPAAVHTRWTPRVPTKTRASSKASSGKRQ